MSISIHPTSASWWNQVEVWFGLLSRKALRGLSSQSASELRQAIEAFIAVYGPTAKPFKWRKREVKGSQLRNTTSSAQDARQMFLYPVGRLHHRGAPKVTVTRDPSNATDSWVAFAPLSAPTGTYTRKRFRATLDVELR